MNRKERRSRRHAAAAPAGGRPVVLAPASGQAGALLSRGAALFQQGRPQEAAALFRQVLNQDPGNLDAHNYLGAIYHEQGNFTAALDHLRAAAAAQPSSAEYLCNLGIAEYSAGDLDSARRDLEKAVALDPRFAKAQYNLGLAYQKSREWQKALDCFNTAAQLAPEDLNPQLAMGNVLVDAGLSGRAIAHFRELQRRHPDVHEIRLGVTVALQEAGRTQEAADELRDVVAKVPGLLASLSKLGTFSANLGNFDEAKTLFNAVLAVKPDFPDALYFMATQARALSTDEGAARLEAALKQPDLSLFNRVDLHIALGHVLNDLRRYDDAFANFKAGNDLSLKMVPYDARTWTDYIEKMIAAFTPEFLSARAAAGSESRKPIFVFGMPRSGTTLVEQILGSHPEVTSGGELTKMPEMIDALPRQLKSSEEYPDCAPLMTDGTIAGLAAGYLAYLEELDAGAAHVTDKMPENFRHLGLLSLMFPKASFIHVRRNPIDTCLSCYMTNLKHPYASSLENLGTVYRGYRRLMDHWRDVLDIPILEVDYEELVANQEEVSRRIVAHCGLEWDDRCLEFHKTERTVNTASIWQVRQPLYKTSVERWRRYEKHLGPLIEALGEYGK